MAPPIEGIEPFLFAVILDARFFPVGLRFAKDKAEGTVGRRLGARLAKPCGSSAFTPVRSADRGKGSECSVLRRSPSLQRSEIY